MASENIRTPLRMTVQRRTNIGARQDDLNMTTNDWSPVGPILPDGVKTRINWSLTTPIPTDINATHNGKIWVDWLTNVAGTTNFKLFYSTQVIVVDVTSVDFTASLSNLVDANNGLTILNRAIIDVSALAALTTGKQLIGVFERDALDAADTLVGDVLIQAAYFVADDTV
jgi:hypothetical protein